MRESAFDSEELNSFPDRKSSRRPFHSLLAKHSRCMYCVCLWRRIVTGVAPGLQNQWTAVRSSVGSTPIRLRQHHVPLHPLRLKRPAGFFSRSIFLHSPVTPIAIHHKYRTDCRRKDSDVPARQSSDDNSRKSTAAIFKTLQNGIRCINCSRRNPDYGWEFPSQKTRPPGRHIELKRNTRRCFFGPPISLLHARLKADRTFSQEFLQSPG